MFPTFSYRRVMLIPCISHRYVTKVLDALPAGSFHLNTAISSVRTTGKLDDNSLKVTLTTADGMAREFDRVIFATHADTTLKILGENATAEEKEVLGNFEWNMNEAVLHSDPAVSWCKECTNVREITDVVRQLMPKSRMAWAAWNYLTSSAVREDGSKAANVNSVALTCKSYLCNLGCRRLTNKRTDGMNTLQHLDEERHGPVLVTLNPPFEPAPDKVVGRWKYEHPVLDAKVSPLARPCTLSTDPAPQAIAAQARIPSIQNTRGIAFAGAWTRYGFHEDGFTSGLRAALAVTQTGNEKDAVRPPFPVVGAERVHSRNEWLATFFELVKSSGWEGLMFLWVTLWCRWYKFVLGL